MTPQRHLLYWGYSFQQEIEFKNLRNKRTVFLQKLHTDAKKSGLLPFTFSNL